MGKKSSKPRVYHLVNDKGYKVETQCPLLDCLYNRVFCQNGANSYINCCCFCLDNEFLRGCEISECKDVWYIPAKQSDKSRLYNELDGNLNELKKSNTRMEGEEHRGAITGVICGQEYDY